MTAQEIFDKVLTHLRKQKAAAMNGAGCVYRNDKEQSCAVGCLIPDDKYRDTMEGTSVRYLRREEVNDGTDPDAQHFMQVLTDLGLEPHLYLLESLQVAHDNVLNSHGLQKWEAEMQAISERHSLTYTSPRAPA
jgi:hypothetical protein